MNPSTPSRWPIALAVLFGLTLLFLWNGVAKGMAAVGTGEIELREAQP